MKLGSKGALDLKSSLLTFVILLLWATPGLGQIKSTFGPKLQEGVALGLCPSVPVCSFVLNRCEGNKDCALQMCPFLFPFCEPRPGCPRLIFQCFNSFPQNENKLETKRSILNKNVAYLLLKLHPILNQTSQYGFLTSGRFRRIGGNFGTEFLGKRSSKTKGKEQTKVRPTQRPKFYSLPLDKLSKAKILKRNFMQELETLREKRMGGGGRVILGSEFLGKRGVENTNNPKSIAESRTKRVVGTELLGKRTEEKYFNGYQQPEEDITSGINKRPTGNEFLGKRNQELYQENLQLLNNINPEAKRLVGNELLGKRNQDVYPNNVHLFEDVDPKTKRLLGNEFLGKRTQEEYDEDLHSTCGGRNTGIRQLLECVYQRKFNQNEYQDELEQFGGNAYEKTKRLIGNEFLGKRNSEEFAESDERTKKSIGNELLGKRKLKEYQDTIQRFSGIYQKIKRFLGNEFLGKRHEEEYPEDNINDVDTRTRRLFGNELLGKRSQKDMEERFNGVEPMTKRLLGNEFLGKRHIGYEEGVQHFNGMNTKRVGNEFLGKRNDYQDDTFDVRTRSQEGNELLGKRKEYEELEYLNGVNTMPKRFGNELLGKRYQDEYQEEPYFNTEDPRIKRPLGNEFLGKRTIQRNLAKFQTPTRRMLSYKLNGNEFLGKRNTENTVQGTELLGKKNMRTFNELLGKRYVGNEMLGKRNTGNELLGKKRQMEYPGEIIWTDYYPEATDEAFLSHITQEQVKASGFCDEACQRTKNLTQKQSLID